MVNAKLSRRGHAHITLILVSAILGAVLVGLVLLVPRGREITTAPVQAQGLSSLQDGFVQLAAQTLPAVVNISAETATRVPGTGMSPGDLDQFFKDNPMFRQFFRDFGTPGEGGGAPGGSPGKRTPQMQRGVSLGSGWIYSPDGYIVTNAHVVRDAVNIKVQLHDRKDDDRQYPATLVASDPKSELAVIKIDAGRKLPALTLGDSESAKVGQWVMAVGSPIALQQSVTVGVLSAKGRTLPGQNAYIQIGDILQTDAAINPGNSGGPLVALDGQVVGINVAIVSPGTAAGNVGIGFAIPADTAKHVIPDLIKLKKVPRGWLGANIEDLSEDMRDFYGAPDGGVLISGLAPDGPAAKSGQLKEEDVVTAVNGRKVHSSGELQRAVMDVAPGTAVMFDVVRAKRPMQATVTLGSLPGKYAGGAAEQPASPAKPEAKSFLGVTVQQITPDTPNAPEKAGVIVTAVDPDGPSAGTLAVGDVITKVNGAETKTVADVQSAVNAAHKANAKYVIVRVMRKMETGDVGPLVLSITPKW